MKTKAPIFDGMDEEGLQPSKESMVTKLFTWFF